MNLTIKNSLIVFILGLFLFSSGCILLKNPNLQNQKIACYNEYEKDANLCFLDDKKESYFFITNCVNQIPNQFSKVILVKDWAECKLEWGNRYDKIAPFFIPQKQDYPDYNKCSENICLICKYHCNVNHDLLDWRLLKVSEIYKKLGDLLNKKQLFEKPVEYVIYNKDTELLGTSSAYMHEMYTGGFYNPVCGFDFFSGEATIHSTEGKNFLYYASKTQQSSEKILHKDYADEVYAETFEDERAPGHEMLHVTFGLKYGGFSYDLEESFTKTIEKFIGGWDNVTLKKLQYNPSETIFPNSFCDIGFKLGEYTLLYHLCMNYGFDINSLPSFFNELDKLKKQKENSNPEFKGKLSNDDFLKALNNITGKNTSEVFNNPCFRGYAYSKCLETKKDY
ncbi:MAG: hypothetical protein COT14_03150 [Candidatus Diapherotrites archaeon CG08_land_8_20_14_0_20_30_16]|nr:MAG: hypothetical protein COT14_03150 [Candidatus Diapherotrites archaeon CG08_land_8_20_14_0_20_30_16]